ncbi:hypothetical protein BSKO_13722 [Bryopsis sp. KO-2023]|nr:hypothetical protein BSKO_13722 [Bryopsis sp. KO-2023]
MGSSLSTAAKNGSSHGVLLFLSRNGSETIFHHGLAQRQQRASLRAFHSSRLHVLSEKISLEGQLFPGVIPTPRKRPCLFPNGSPISTLMQPSQNSSENWSHFIIQLQNEEAKKTMTAQDMLDLVFKLQKMGGAVPSKVWDRVGKLIGDHSASFTPHDIIGVLHVFAKVQHANPSVIYDLCYTLDIINLSQTWIPTLFYSLGLLSKTVRPAESIVGRNMEGDAISETWTEMPELSLPSGFLDKVLVRSGLPKSISNLNERHIACMVYGMGQLNSPDLIPWAVKILDEVWRSGKLADLSPKGLSMIVYSMGKMKLKSKETVYPFLERLSDRQVVASLPLEGLSNVMISLGKLGMVDSVVRSGVGSVLDEICRHERLARLSSWDLASTWSGLAATQFHCDRNLEILVQETAKPRRIASMSEQGLTSTIHSVVALGVKDSAFLDGLIGEVMKPDRLAELSVNGGSMVLSSLARLRADSPEKWGNEIETVVLQMTEMHRLTRTTLQDLEGIIHGLSVVTRRKQPHEAVDRVLWRIKMWGIRGKLSELSSRKYTSLIRALSSIGVLDRLVWNVVLKEMFPRKSRYHEFQVNDLSSLIHCLGGLAGYKIKGLRYVDAILDSLIDWVVKSKDRLRECSHVGLANVILGISRAGKLDKEVGKLLAEEMLSDGRLLYFPLSELRAVVVGFVRGSSISEDSIRVLLDRLVLMEDGSDGPSAAWVLHSFTKGPVVRLGSVMDKLMVKIDYENLSNRHLSMIAEAVGSFRLPNSKGLDKFLSESLKPQRLTRYTDKQFVWLIFMLGRLGMKRQEPIDRVIRLFLHDNRLARLPPTSISTSFYGLALLGHAVQSHYDTILDKLRGKKGFEELSDNALLNVLHGMGKISYDNEKNLNEILQAVGTPERVDRLLTTDRVGVVFHTAGRLARMHRVLSSDFLNWFEKATAPKAIRLLPERALGSIVFALSHLDEMDQRIVDRTLKEICFPGRLNVFSWRRMVDILYRLHELDFSEEGGKPIDAFLKEIDARADRGEFEPAWLNQIVVGLLNLSEKRPQFGWALELLDKTLTEKNLAQMDVRRLARLVTTLEQRSNEVDMIAKHFKNALEHLCREDRREEIRLCSATEVKELLLMFSRLGKEEVGKSKEGVVARLVREVSKPERMIRYEVGDIEGLVEACKALPVNDPEVEKLQEGRRVHLIEDVFSVMETPEANPKSLEVKNGS